MRTAETHRDAEPLGAAERDVGAELARRREQGQRERIGSDGGMRSARVRRSDGGSQVTNLAAGARILQQDSEQVAVRLSIDEFGRHRPGH